MSTPLPELQGLLLDMLSTKRPVDASTIDGMDAEDWERLMAMARQHRVLPLLHWRLGHERIGLPVPESIRDSLGSDYRRWGLRMLRMQRELLLIHRLLEDAGIPHLSLKGAYLAFYAYPQPALRPMRDLDILVPEDRALETYDRLIAAGYLRMKGGDPAATMQTRNHLPELSSPVGGINIEIHTRLFDPDEANAADLTDDPRLWQRTIGSNVAGETLRYASPTDLLLHLVEHAVYHHHFDNGPLTLSDVAYLLEGHTIEWPEFWQLAERFGLTRGAILLLRTVERYYGILPVEWTNGCMIDPASIQRMVETVALLSLGNLNARRDLNLESEVRQQSTVRGRLWVLFRRVFPSKGKMATLYPVSATSNRVYLWYFVQFWHVITVRLSVYLRYRMADHSEHDVQHVLRLERWLQDGAGE